VENTKTAAQMHVILVEAGDVAKRYTTCGQYLQIKVGDSKPAFLAIANAPGSVEKDTLEFLVKSVPGTTADQLTKLEAGADVCSSHIKPIAFGSLMILVASLCTCAADPTPHSWELLVLYVCYIVGRLPAVKCLKQIGVQVSVGSVEMREDFTIASVPPEVADMVLIFATGTGIRPIKALIPVAGPRRLFFATLSF
jgi:hypothetical protein